MLLPTLRWRPAILCHRNCLSPVSKSSPLMLPSPQRQAIDKLTELSDQRPHPLTSGWEKWI
jgi:hypothetical protein